MSKKEITITLAPIEGLQRQVESFEIATEDDMTAAVTFLSELNKQNDRNEAEKAKVMRPALDTVAAERARWKPVETILNGAITTMRKKISAWQTEQKRIADEEAEKISARVGEGRGKLKADTAIRKMDEIEKPSEAVNTASGQVKFRTDRKFEVTDLSLLPLDYHVANEVKIRAALKTGTELPGVKYWNEETPINFR